MPIPIPSNDNPGERITTDPHNDMAEQPRPHDVAGIAINNSSDNNIQRPGTDDPVLTSAVNSRAPSLSTRPTDQCQRRRSLELLLDLLVMEARLQGWAMDSDSDRGLEDNLHSYGGTEAADLSSLATHQLFQELVGRYRLQEQEELFERLGALVLQGGDPEMVNGHNAKDYAEHTESRDS